MTVCRAAMPQQILEATLGQHLKEQKWYATSMAPFPNFKQVELEEPATNESEKVWSILVACKAL